MEKKLSPTQITLDIWAGILIVWSIYRSQFSLPPWFDEFIAKPIVFIVPVYFYIAYYTKKDFFKSIWFTNKNIFKELLLGCVVAFLIILSSIASHYIRQGSFPVFKSISIITIVIAFATAISEEILSRGFVVKRLYEESKNVFSSVFLGSILFFILHIPILFTMPKLSGSLLLVFMITDLLLGVINSFLFLSRKNLILPIFVHAFYTIMLLLYI